MTTNQTEIARSPEIIISPEAVAIVATTRYVNWYPGTARSIRDTDKVRGDLCLQTATAASKAGYLMLVADSGSPTSFTEKLAALGTILVPRTDSSRAGGRRNVISAAAALSNVDVIVKTEPEKVSLVERCIPQIILPIFKGDASIVVPQRNAQLFRDSHPAYMYDSETSANRWYNGLLRKVGYLPENQDDLDIFFSPVAFKNDPQIVAMYMERFSVGGSKEFGVRKYADPSNWSEAQFYPIVRALKEGIGVKSVEVPYYYPSEQRANEEASDATALAGFIQKRKEQKYGIVDDLKQYVRFLEHSPRTLLTPVVS